MSENFSDPVSILQALIRCPSITPAEGGALTQLQLWLETLGFTVFRPAFQEEATEKVENLFACFPAQKDERAQKFHPHLVFAGHTDVVPPGRESAWTHPPFAGICHEGRVYGRGAVDMKGAIAAFLSAVSLFLPTFRKKSVGTLSFLITGDEEGPALNGTRALLAFCKEGGFHFDACLLGEPTNAMQIGDTIKVGRRGSLSFRLDVQGKQGHVAYPHLAHNPIPMLLDILKALISEKLDAGTQAFQPSHLEITTIDVDNTALNVIPEHASAFLNVRFSPLWTQETLTQHLRECVSHVAQKISSSSRVELTALPGGSDAFLTQNSALTGALTRAITQHTTLVPQHTTSGGTSDARFIKEYCPVVEFGLLSRTMHQIDEHVCTEELTLLRDIYLTFLCDYFMVRSPEHLDRLSVRRCAQGQHFS